MARCINAYGKKYLYNQRWINSIAPATPGPSDSLIAAMSELQFVQLRH